VSRDVHLATEDGFEGFLSFLLPTLIDAAYVVVKLLDAEHIAMIGNGHTTHTVGNSLVYKPLNARLTIEY
jgi:hypothetical protein